MSKLQEAFEIVDGELWRKANVHKNGHKHLRKLVKNVANCNGYCFVRFKGRQMYYHRIVWVLLNGDIPVGMEIDHIDGNRVNNNIGNLRLVNHKENQQNLVMHRNGNLVGCTYFKRLCKWQAQVWVDGKYKYLGLYDTEQEAHDVYLKALEDRSDL